MSSKSELKIDWATHEAAKHACENWHYSKCLPSTKLLKVGAWENGKFIGVVIFSNGASPLLGRKFGLDQWGCCELTRVALREHETPVTRIISVAIRFLKKNSPGIKVIVSFADPAYGHHGGIYQAGNWLYTGQSAETIEHYIDGRWMHRRGAWKVIKKLKEAEPTRKRPGKYRYVYFLDEALKQKFSHLVKPYPRGGSKEDVAPAFPAGEGGLIPTSPLQLKKRK